MLRRNATILTIGDAKIYESMKIYFPRAKHSFVEWDDLPTCETKDNMIEVDYIVLNPTTHDHLMKMSANRLLMDIAALDDVEEIFEYLRKHNVCAVIDNHVTDPFLRIRCVFYDR